MKRRDLIKHLRMQGVLLAREGSKHSVFFNPKHNFTSAVPRHTEINDFLVKKICKDLGIDSPI